MTRAYNMDCMEAMREMPDGYYDLAICDPPYGIGIDGQKLKIGKNPKHNRKYHPRKGWDTAPPSDEYFRELERVSRHQVIFGANYFLPSINQRHRGWIVWYKGQQDLTMSDCELAYSSFDTPTRVVIINRNQLQKEGETIHPTQKPVALYEWILSRYAKPGDKILDTHLGSGSSRIAAYDMGLDFTGYEIDKDYFEAQEERFQAYAAQISLF